MIVDPGFEYSTKAVADGYYNAFTELGYEVIQYDTLTSLNIIRAGLSGRETCYEQITEMACAPIINQVINDSIDCVFMIHGYWMNPSIIIALRNLCVKTALILTDDPMQVDVSTQWSKFYEFIFTNERNTRQFHHNCTYLPMAVDNSIFYPINKEELDVKYRSQILIGGSLYKERVDFIDNSPELIDVLLKWDTKIVGSRKTKFKDERLNNLFGENRISIEEMAKYVAGTEICIDIPKNEYFDAVFGNSNREKIKASCLSPRIFECCASKIPVLTSRDRSDMVELYDKPCGFDDYGWTYENDKDLANQLNNFLLKKRNYAVDKMYEHTIKNHTYVNRVKIIEEKMRIHPSITDLRDDHPINIIVGERWDKNWNQNYYVGKQAQWFTKWRGIDNLRTSVEQNYFKGGLHTTPVKTDEVDIISNGPSFEQNFDKCKDHNIIKFYLNQAIEYKTSKDINFAVVIHPDFDVFERCYEKANISGVELIASTLANYKVIKKWHDEFQNFWFFNTGCEKGIKKIVYEDTKYPVLSSGFTVAFSAMVVAKFLGFKKINIYGVDFCYLNNRQYAFSDLNYEKVNKRLLSLVPDAKGCPVFTNPIMLKSRDAVLEFIEHNPDIEFRVYGRGILIGKNCKNLINVF